MAEEIRGIASAADVEPLPAPEPAANARSPERRPRIKRAMKSWEARIRRKAWLKIYLLTGNPALACERVGCHPHTIDQWKRDLAWFKEEFEAIEVMWKETVMVGVESLPLKSMMVIEKVLDQALVGKGMETGLRAALKVLGSHGYLPEKVEHVGAGGGPIKAAVVHTVEVLPPAGLLVEGKVKELEEGQG